MSPWPKMALPQGLSVFIGKSLKIFSSATEMPGL